MTIISATTFNKLWIAYDWLETDIEPDNKIVNKYVKIPTYNFVLYKSRSTNDTIMVCDFDESRNRSWCLIALNITTDKFKLSVILENEPEPHEGFSDDQKHPQITNLVVTNRAWENRNIELEYINGGTEEDIILYMMAQ